MTNITIKQNIEIPKQLQSPDFRFVKLPHKSKKPFEKEWQNKPCNLEEIKDWIKQGNNYGVAGGYGSLIVIDADDLVIKNLVGARLPLTFTIKSGSGGNKRHFYYFCPEIKEKVVLREGTQHYGEIISFGSQAVGPNSIHPDTNALYEVVGDIAIATVSKEDIFSTLADYLSHLNKKDYEIENNINLNVFDILRKFGISTEHTGRQLQISHPIHDSTNGCNFVVNQEKNVWHCFRCDSGGGVMSLIAVLEKIIDCNQAVPGGLRGEDFKNTIRIACKKYGLKEESNYEDAEENKELEESPIDISQFQIMASKDLIKILGLTIKQDEDNKISTFLCELSAYTESAQFNISFNAPSSTGKSFIPTEIAQLFPSNDVVEIGYCSPTAFFHDIGEPDKEKKGKIVVDLSRKILIFLDQPHTQLLERLRPLLSHDKKEISIKITDKNQKQGLKTKNVILRGFPAVIFCTAGLKIDEQEATRFLLLSPETSQEKIRAAIQEKIKKESDKNYYKSWLEEVPERKQLQLRIKAIKQANIKEVNFNPHEVEKIFLGHKKALMPRHQRDIGRLISLIKGFALLNLWWREKDGSTITANKNDIKEAFKLWNKISVSQELNLPPYIYNLYNDIILVAWKEKNANREDMESVTGKLGLGRQEMLEKHYQVYGRMLDAIQLRQQILPMLETAGLIIQEKDPGDNRKMVIYPTSFIEKEERYSEQSSGVKEETTKVDEIDINNLPF